MSAIVNKSSDSEPRIEQIRRASGPSDIIPVICRIKQDL